VSIRPADSPIRLTAEQEKHVNELTSVGEISAYMRSLALEQGLVAQLQGAEPGVLVDVPQPTRKTTTVVVDGKTVEFSADTDDELTKLQLEYFRGRNTATPAADAAAKTAEPARDPATGKFVSQKDPALAAADQAMLDLKFKRGEISVTDYLLESGAMEQYVQKQYDRANEADVRSWAESVEVFKQTTGADWPGGDANRQRLGHIIGELGLTDAPDKTGALTQAWNEMKRQDAESAMNSELRKCQSKSEIDAVLQKYSSTTGIPTNAGGGVFGR
jgi:hypothetical protein